MPDDSRPNPDAPFSSTQREEAARGRGRLKVFLGMGAGVGKIYSMLQAARHVVSKRGTEVKLSATDYALLALMVRHASRVLTH